MTSLPSFKTKLLARFLPLVQGCATSCECDWEADGKHPCGPENVRVHVGNLCTIVPDHELDVRDLLLAILLWKMCHNPLHLFRPHTDNCHILSIAKSDYSSVRRRKICSPARSLAEGHPRTQRMRNILHWCAASRIRATYQIRELRPCVTEELSLEAWMQLKVTTMHSVLDNASCIDAAFRINLSIQLDSATSFRHQHGIALKLHADILALIVACPTA